MPKVNLNESFISKGLVCPAEKSKIEYVSTTTPGFFVEVRATSQGQGTYYYRYKAGDGKMKTVKIGRTSDISFKKANSKLQQLREQVFMGEDPKEDMLAMKQIPTFKEYFESTYLPHAKEHKKTWVNDEQMFRTHLCEHFGHLKLNCINRSDVNKFHLNLKKMNLRASTCNHYVKLLRHVLNTAVDSSLIQRNSLINFKLYKEENQVERYLNPDEQVKLLDVLRNDTNIMVANLILCLLATGARRSEVFKMKWEHIDLDKRLWTIPAANAKSGKTRSVPLNEVAIEAITKVNTKGIFSYVFPSSDMDKPYRCIKTAWYRMRSAAGLSKVRLHDLRHQYASLLVNAGRSLYEVQKILGHSSPQVTQRYAHLSQERLQEASEAAAKLLK